MSHRTNRLPALLISIVLPALAYTSEGQAHATPPRKARTTWDSVYPPEQAARGETTYTKTCARCHAPALGGKDEAPALTGSGFMGGWNGVTMFDLLDRVRTTMPSDTPGTYSRQDIVDVLAYMLKFNQFPAGKADMPSGDEELKGITFVIAKP